MTASSSEAHAEEPRTKRMRLFGKQENPHAVMRNFHKAWAAYLRGNVVSDHAARIIKNFLLAVLAEGHHHDKIDEVQDTTEADAKVVVGDLSIARVHELLNAQLKVDAQAAEAEGMEKGSRRLIKAMQVTASFWQLPTGAGHHCKIRAQEHCRKKPAEPAATTAASDLPRKTGAVLYRGRWKARYEQWRAEVDNVDLEGPPQGSRYL